MGIKKFKPITPGLRHAELPDFSELTDHKPEKSLLRPLKKSGGRNNMGRVTMRGRGGGHKRRYRQIDFARNKLGVPAKVISREYDPNRSSWITLLHYADGEKRYIISPLELNIGQEILSGKEGVEAKPGNAMPLKIIPQGLFVHNIEFFPGGRGKIARAAGTQAQIMAKEDNKVRLKLPSGEIRIFHEDCMATVGQVGNIDHKNIVHGKAGRRRHLGRRPITRGVAMNPVDHPHGGGEGRSYVGGPHRSFSGRLAKGERTRKKNKKSNEFIVVHARDAKKRRR